MTPGSPTTPPLDRQARRQLARAVQLLRTHLSGPVSLEATRPQVSALAGGLAAYPGFHSARLDLLLDALERAQEGQGLGRIEFGWNGHGEVFLRVGLTVTTQEPWRRYVLPAIAAAGADYWLEDPAGAFFRWKYTPADTAPDAPPPEEEEEEEEPPNWPPSQASDEEDLPF